jgi:hypothetical protein
MISNPKGLGDISAGRFRAGVEYRPVAPRAPALANDCPLGSRIETERLGTRAPHRETRRARARDKRDR